MLVRCASGLAFHARKWKIGDRRNLHDRNILKQGLLMRKMLEAVDEGIESPGPYPFEVGKKVPWAKACLTDIIDALIQIRITTKPMLDYNEICEQCGAQIPLSIDLRHLKQTPMSSEGKAHLSSGEPIVKTVDLRDPESMEGEATPSVQMKFRMLRGEDMPKITQHYKQEPTTVQEAQIVMHIVELLPPGVKEPLKLFQPLQDFYADQDWYFHEAIDRVIAEFGGGVVTLVDMACRRCNAEQQSILPFGAEFFYPRTKSNISSMGAL
jgi:hypothetical protein